MDCAKTITYMFLLRAVHVAVDASPSSLSASRDRSLLNDGVLAHWKFTDPRLRYLPRYMWASDNSSYAQYTVHARIPAVIKTLLNDFKQYSVEVQQNQSNNANISAEIGDINDQLTSLLLEAKQNQALHPFPPSHDFAYLPNKDDFHDLDEWNWALNSTMAKNQRNGQEPPTWSDSPITFVECYFYRLISFIFQKSNHFHHWDHFSLAKAASLVNNTNNIHALFDYLENTLEKIALTKDKFSQETKSSFKNLILLSTWGNKGDLAFSAAHNKTDPVDHDFHLEIDRVKELLLADDTEQIWLHLVHLNNQTNTTDIRVDLICDNYGFESTTDVILGEFLIASKLATQVRYHVKPIPWFMSDTTIPDFHRTLSLADEHSGGFGAKWRRYLDEKKFVVETNEYWTLPYDYDWMDVKSPSLYAELSKADLLIFKGDLNYRKLTGELAWPATTSFDYALRTFAPTALCALRGQKSSAIVGLEAGRAEELWRQDKEWATSGKYAVVQFSNKKASLGT